MKPNYISPLQSEDFFEYINTKFGITDAEFAHAELSPASAIIFVHRNEPFFENVFGIAFVYNAQENEATHFLYYCVDSEAAYFRDESNPTQKIYPRDSLSSDCSYLKTALCRISYEYIQLKAVRGYDLLQKSYLNVLRKTIQASLV
tara:strand:- start:4722 stop:5159 length:438 start_codon:yes stop_codon:yes gene_type:complete